MKNESGIYYPHRTYRKYRSVLKDIRLHNMISGECFEKLILYLKKNSLSQKEEDAREVLKFS